MYNHHNKEHNNLSDDILKIGLEAKPDPKLVPIAIFILLVGIFWAIFELENDEIRYTINFIPCSWFLIFLGVGILIMYPFYKQNAEAIRELSISNQGIKKEGLFIEWNSIYQIYQYDIHNHIIGLGILNKFDKKGGTVKKVLKLKDYHGRIMKISFYTHNHSDSEFYESYNNLINIIITKTSKRHYEEVLIGINSGQPISFGCFSLQRDKLFFSRKPGDGFSVHFQYITGYQFSKEGNMLIEFFDNNKKKFRKRILGNVKDIANLHIVTAFLNTIISQESRINNSLTEPLVCNEDSSLFEDINDISIKRL